MNIDLPSIRLDANYRNLDRVITWIRDAESRAPVVLTANTILFGLISAKISDEVRALFHGGTNLQIATSLLFLGYVVSSGLSFVRAMRVFFPKLKGAEPSLFYFGSISNLTRDEFEGRMKTLDAAKIESELIRQTYINAQIATQKFANVQHALMFLAVSLGLGACVLLLKSLN